MSGLRRDNLTGTIYQRPNGTWVARVAASHSALGRLKYKYTPGKSDVDVKKKIRTYAFSNNSVVDYFLKSLTQG